MRKLLYLIPVVASVFLLSAVVARGATVLFPTGGGTGWAAIQAGAIPYGNGTGRLSTTTQGTGGFILSWANGIPAWVATTTFSGGLTYSGGNVTNTLTAGDGLTRTVDDIDCDTANTSTFGCLTDTDWDTFNNKQGTISLTTTGSSGAATFDGATLNIPQYSGGGSYPFPLAGNATSSLTQFNGGLTAFASSTIGDSNQDGGLTISGGATTTGNGYFASNVCIGTENCSGADLTISSAASFQAPISNATIHVVGANNQSVRAVFDTNNASNAFGTLIQGRRSRGPAASPSAVTGGDVLLQLAGAGYGTSEYVSSNGSKGIIAIKGDATWTNTNSPVRIEFFTVPDSSVTNALRFTIGKAGQWGIGGTASQVASDADFGDSGEGFISQGAGAAPAWVDVWTEAENTAASYAPNSIFSHYAATFATTTAALSLPDAGYIGFAGNNAITTSNYSLFGNTTLTLLNARSGASIGFRIANTDVANFSTTGGFGFGSTYYNLDPGQNNMIVEGRLGVGSSTPWKSLSVGSGNVGTFAISTSTAGVLAISSKGEVYSVGTLGVALGGTGLSSVTANAIIYGDSAGTAYAAVATSSLNLGISGGGTGLTSVTGNRIIYSNSAGTAFAQVATSSLGLGVSGGGTGIATCTNNRLITGNGTSAFVCEANLTFDGSLLTVTGGATTTQLTTTGSTYLASAGGNVGIASTTPAFRFSVGTAGADFYIDSTGKVVARDTTNSWSGRLSPTRAFGLSSATTTTWTGTTTGEYVPSIIMPFAGTLRTSRCQASTTTAFLGTAVRINATSVTPSYFVASATVGTISYTANNTFTAGQRISAYFGTTTTDAAADSVTCTFEVTETP